MTKKELLEIVLRLQDKVSKLEERIEELEKPRPKPIYPWAPIGPGKIDPLPIIQPQEMCTDGLPHDYESPWWGTMPPPCKKCGKQAQQPTITCEMQQIISDAISATTVCDCGIEHQVALGKNPPVCSKCGRKGSSTINS